MRPSPTTPRTSRAHIITRMRPTDCLPRFTVKAGLAFLLCLPACQPNDMQALLEPSQALASVLAEESLRVAGARKQVALITHDISWGPPSTTEQTLRAVLKKHGATLLTVKAANLGNPMFSGEIGL